ncbi:MAG: aldehyde dehydrogenase [Proteobacteria bacterium]|nr:aldehyde dehydrogenase [Pseudomonadota bacterium]
MSSDRAETYPLRRREVVARLVADRGELLVVGGLGAPSWDLTAAGDHPLTFPLWGAMGGAAMIGLGLALARPTRRVLVVTGDGEMLMGLGALATIAVQAPANLAVVVLDNERYGETGMQATHTAGPTNLSAVAAGAGIPVVGDIFDQAQLEAALPRIRAEPGPVFFNIKVRAEDLPLVLPPKDGVRLKDRFRAALLGPEAAG